MSWLGNPLVLGGASLVCAAAWVAVAIAARRNWRLMVAPVAAPPTPAGGWPRVTIVVPARNEERALPAALASLLALDYPDLEVILINDHSSDRTGAILDDFATHATASASASAPRSWSVLHDPPLPAGWMGKNNAVWTAARRATGDWLLFTDADIVFAPDAVRRAVAHALRAGNDIQPMCPYVEVGSPWERCCLPPLAMLGLGTFFDVATSRDPARAHAMGVGAFTLVRREPYFAAGGHAAIAGEVVEDVELARLMKKSGARYDILDGTGLISVRMYTGLRSLFEGFRKNMYSGAGKRAGLSLAIVVGLPIVMALPFAVAMAAVAAAIVGSRGGAIPGTGMGVSVLEWLALGGVALASYGAVAVAIWRGSRSVCASRFLPQLLHPVVGFILGAIVAASTWDGAIRRRVLWRGRSVPIDRRRG